MNTKKILAVLLALVMVLALFAGCGKTETPDPTKNPEQTTTPDTPPEETKTPDEQPTDTPKETKKIKVGHLIDLTGVESSVGLQSQKAFNFALSQLTFDGFEIEVIDGDCQSSAATAAEVAQKMVEQDGVVAIFGPTQIGHKSSVGAYLAGADTAVPLIVYNGTPVGIMKKSQWIVGEGGGTAQLPTVMADYVWNTLKYTKVYTIRQDTTGGDNYVGAFEDNFKALGGEIVDSYRLTVDGSDYAAQLATMDPEKADAICGWTSSSDAINFWKAWYELGFAGKLPVCATMHGGFTDFFVMKALNAANPDIVKAIIEQPTYSVISYCMEVENEANEALVEAWKTEFNEVPPGNNLAGACYQALMVLQQALEISGGETEPEALLEAIWKVDFSGPEGHVKFENGSQAATKDVNVVKVNQLEDGSFNYSIIDIYEDVPGGGLTVG